MWYDIRRTSLSLSWTLKGRPVSDRQGSWWKTDKQETTNKKIGVGRRKSQTEAKSRLNLVVCRLWLKKILWEDFGGIRDGPPLSSVWRPVSVAVEGGRWKEYVASKGGVEDGSGLSRPFRFSEGNWGSVQRYDTRRRFGVPVEILTQKL